MGIALVIANNLSDSILFINYRSCSADNSSHISCLSWPLLYIPALRYGAN